MLIMKNMKHMIKRAALLILCFAGLFCACTKENTEGMDTTTLRISVTPEPGLIPAAGLNFVSGVVVNKGMEFEVPWEVSVDFNPSWIHVTKTTKTSHYVGTYAGDDADYEVAAIDVTVDPNDTGAKRTANLRFKTDAASSIVYTINQAAN